MTWRTYPVPDGLAGQRVDAVVATLTGLSRAKVQSLMGAGAVLCDGAVPTKSDKLSANAVIEVDLPGEDNPFDVLTPADDLVVMYEDEDIVVVDKPAGIAAHPSLNFVGPNVVGALRARGISLAPCGDPGREGIVHRLDVGTSGVMVVAKSADAFYVLKDAFRYRLVDKRYHTVVQGHLDNERGTIEAPIGRDMRHQWKMGIRADGKPAVTHFHVMERLNGADLVSIKLETGRTHQIRVHMSALHHPCVGDTQYGADPTVAARLGLERQWLHAVQLSFTHPTTEEEVTFTSDYSHDLWEALDALRGHASTH